MPTLNVRHHLARFFCTAAVVVHCSPASPGHLTASWCSTLHRPDPSSPAETGTKASSLVAYTWYPIFWVPAISPTTRTMFQDGTSVTSTGSSSRRRVPQVSRFEVLLPFRCCSVKHGAVCEDCDPQHAGVHTLSINACRAAAAAAGRPKEAERCNGASLLT